MKLLNKIIEKINESISLIFTSFGLCRSWWQWNKIISAREGVYGTGVLCLAWWSLVGFLHSGGQKWKIWMVTYIMLELMPFSLVWQLKDKEFWKINLEKEWQFLMFCEAHHFLSESLLFISILCLLFINLSEMWQNRVMCMFKSAPFTHFSI